MSPKRLADILICNMLCEHAVNYSIFKFLKNN